MRRCIGLVLCGLLLSAALGCRKTEDTKPAPEGPAKDKLNKPPAPPPPPPPPKE